jgi:hypothetical protein
LQISGFFFLRGFLLRCAPRMIQRTFEEWLYFVQSADKWRLRTAYIATPPHRIRRRFEMCAAMLAQLTEWHDMEEYWRASKHPSAARLAHYYAEAAADHHRLQSEGSNSTSCAILRHQLSEESGKEGGSWLDPWLAYTGKKTLISVALKCLAIARARLSSTLLIAFPEDSLEQRLVIPKKC